MEAIQKNVKLWRDLLDTLGLRFKLLLQDSQVFHAEKSILKGVNSVDLMGAMTGCIIALELTHKPHQDLHSPCGLVP